MAIDETVTPADLLEQILQTSLDGILLCRAVRSPAGDVTDFRVIRCNERAAVMTGFSRHQMVTTSMLTLDPDGHATGIFQKYKQVVETGLPLYVEHYFAGGNVWMAQSLARFGDGVLTSCVDISALKRAERANLQQTELLRSVLDNSANPIIAFSAVRSPETGRITDFRYVAHNEANRRTMNRTDEEILGHTLLEFFPGMAETSLPSQFAAVVESGRAVQVEQEFAEEGWNGWFDVSVRKWGDGIVLTLVDVTAGKSHQRQLEQANRDLLRANDNLRQFAYIASHDLQEPLRKLVAFGDILQAQHAPQLGPSGGDIIDRMQSAARRMSVLIKDVLAYSRVGTHREPFQSVELSQLVAAIQHELSAELQSAGATLNVRPLPTVRGDRAQLGQLFTNLLTNALKFRRPDQPLAVRVESWMLSPDQPAASGWPADLDSTLGYHVICLTDNGIGFEDKHTERIFQVFQRLHSRQQYEGTGIGLAICKRVVENHYGAITATSQPGEGSTFRVYLPG